MAVYRWGSTVTIGAANTTFGGGYLDFAAGPSITALPDGGFAVAWTEGTGINRAVAMQIFSATGAAVSEKLNPAPTGGATYMPDITRDAANLVLTWTRDTNNAGDEAVFLRLLNLDGTPVSGAQAVANTLGVDEFQSAVDARSSGSVAAYVVSTGSGDVIMSLRGTNGAQVASVTVASGANTQVVPAVEVLAGGRIVVGWVDATVSTSEYRVSIFSSSGTAIGGATNLPVASAATAPGGSTPSIAALSSGGFVVAWDDGADRPTDTNSFHIGYQLFNESGVKIGAERVANIIGTDIQAVPNVVVLADGGFLITWQDARESGTSLNVFGARFDGEGNRVGVEFQLTGGVLREGDPAMALLSDGRVAATWIDENDGRVKFQILDPRDGVVGGTRQADTLYGHDILPTQLSGESGNDVLIGGNSTDMLFGGDGDDVLEGRAGGDGLNGGAGNDTATYANATAGLTASLANPGQNTGEAAADIYTSIENLAGSSFGDLLVGNTGFNTLDGRGGDDTLVGGANADAIIGGTGLDFASYAGASAGVTARLDFSTLNQGEAAGDTYSSIEGLIGSSYFDFLVGNANENWLQAGANADYVAGVGGDDLLLGQDGADTLDGGTGNDTLLGGAGGDSLLGGGGEDFASYADATSAVTVRLDFPTLNRGDAAGDVLVGISGLIGSAFDDTLVGTTGAQTLQGGAGMDSLIGRGGADVLFGGAGLDFFAFAAADFEAGVYDVIKDMYAEGTPDWFVTTGVDAASIVTLDYLGGVIVTLASLGFGAGSGGVYIENFSAAQFSQAFMAM